MASAHGSILVRRAYYGTLNNGMSGHYKSVEQTLILILRCRWLPCSLQRSGLINSGTEMVCLDCHLPVGHFDHPSITGQKCHAESNGIETSRHVVADHRAVTRFFTDPLP